MGVYIKGLNMPKEPICLIIFPVDSNCGNVMQVQELNDARKASGVIVGHAFKVKTPHGRLIDADALCENGTADVHEDMVCDGYVEDSIWGFSRDTILRRPVIIEAEGKDDG